MMAQVIQLRPLRDRSSARRRFEKAFGVLMGAGLIARELKLPPLSSSEAAELNGELSEAIVELQLLMQRIRAGAKNG